MAAFFLGGQLILEMDASRPGLDHRLHQFENIQGATKTSLSIGDDGSKPVDIAAPFSMLDLVGTLQGLVDFTYYLGNTVGRIEALIRIHLSGEISISGNLPAAQVNGLQTRPHLLDRLIASECA